VSRYLEPEVVQRLNALTLSGRRVVEGAVAGIHRSPVKGASVEFRQHRAYVAGDEPRRLDWRVLARTDRPYVREYDQETNLRAVLVLDASGSMAYGGRQEATGKWQAGEMKFQYAASVVASLAYLMLAQTESVGIAVSGTSGIDWSAPAAGTGQLARIIDVLERSTPRNETDLAKTVRDVAERVGRRSMIVVVSDFLAPVPALRTGFARLAHAKHEAIALRILHPDEVEFPFRNWCRFHGLEHEPARLVEPAMMRDNYLVAFRRHRDELEQTCRSLGVEFHTLMTDRPMVDSLIAVLKHRSEKQIRDPRREIRTTLR